MGRVYQSQSSLEWPRPRAAEKGMTPSDMWSMFRLRREMAGAPGSDVANYQRLMQQQILDQKKQKYDQLKETINLNHQLMKDTNSLAGKQLYYTKLQSLFSSIPENERGLFQAISPIDPKVLYDMRATEFISRNPEPPLPDSEIDQTDVSKAALMWDRHDKWQRLVNKELHGQEESVIPLHVIKSGAGEDRYYVIDGAAVPKEYLDPMIKNIEDKTGIPAATLVATGGEGKPQVFTNTIIGEDGKSYVTATEHYFNHFNGNSRLKHKQLGESPGQTPPPFKLPPETKTGSTDPALGWAAVNGLVSKDQLSRDTQGWTAMIEQGQEMFAKDSGGFKYFMATAGSMIYGNYTMLVQTKEDDIKLQQSRLMNPMTWFYPRIETGKGSSLIKVPGKPIPFKSADGKEFWAVVDTANGTIHDSDGLWLNQFYRNKSAQQILDDLSSKTSEELKNGLLGDNNTQ